MDLQLQKKLLMQPWIYKRNIDLAFICLPSAVCALLVIIFAPYFTTTNLTSTWWLVVVLGIDVSHVYTTLYKTYWDKTLVQQKQKLLLLVPFIAFIMAFIAINIGFNFFWRVLAYIAVFHFIRQQYGFVKIYSRKQNNYMQWLDTLVIYSATIYPILYWHCNGPFQFTWFTAKDFVTIPYPIVDKIAFYLYCLIIIAYCIKEIVMFIKTKTGNLPKNLVIIGTLISWYLGIVYYNSDLIFTILNVVTHGVPYMALVWINGKANATKATLPIMYKGFGICIFLLIPFVLGYVEEGLWDTIIWKEHTNLFGVFEFINQIDTTSFKTIIIPILILPQLTHYLLDGFIWRIKKGEVP